MLERNDKYYCGIRKGLLNHITKVFEQKHIYSEKKVHKQLLEDGYKVSLNTIVCYHQELGLQAVLSYKISNIMDN